MALSKIAIDTNIAIEVLNGNGLTIKKHLRDIGCPIPENDIWIAAICSFYDIPLLTRDGHFERIPMLKRLYMLSISFLVRSKI